jgi:hypothetical protein
LADEALSIKYLTIDHRLSHQKQQINGHMKRLKKPIQFVNKNNKYDATYRSISAFNFIHSADVLPEYDYFSKIFWGCRRFLESQRYETDIESNRYLRDSVIRERAKDSFNIYQKNKERIVEYRSNEVDDIFLKLIVPKKLSKLIYKGTHVPPKQVFKPLFTKEELHMMAKANKGKFSMKSYAKALGAPTHHESSSDIRKNGVSAPWPEDIPTHFKLDQEE